jgi:hypothetical protein
VRHLGTRGVSTRMKKYSTERLFGDVYLATTSSSANSNGTRDRIGYALSDGIAHVAFVCMTIRVYSKTLVLGPTLGNARAGSQSTIHPKLTGRRWARVTYRTHGHRRAARNMKRLPIKILDGSDSITRTLSPRNKRPQRQKSSFPWPATFKGCPSAAWALPPSS